MMRVPVTNLWTQPGAKPYATLALASIAVVGIVMLQRGSELLALIPVLAGLIGGVSGFSPMIFVAAVAICLNASGFTEPFTSRRMVMDVVLCMAVLAFVIAQYRLQSLLGNIYPIEPRKPREAVSAKRTLWLFPRRSPAPRVRRSPELVNASEIGGVLWSLPIGAALACSLFLALPTNPGSLNLLPPIRQGITLVWLFGVAWIVVFSFFEYLQYRHMSHDEAVVCLQDMVWNETRREQRRLGRWLAWQFRRQPRKEKP
jgi:hypothetical protein